MTLDELKDEVQEYADRGFHQDVVNASYEARKAVRLFIARTHPRTAFGGKTLTDGMFIRGRFEIQASVIGVRVYANYFARWYNTGAFGRVILYGKRKGQKGPTYPARGNYFESNRTAIEEYYAAEVDKYLKDKVIL